MLKIKSKHKELTDPVVKYIKKSFSYAVAQNKENESGLQAALTALPQHMFGDHANCGTWCTFAQNPDTYKHKSFGKGKDLTSIDLRSDLEKIMTNLARNAGKLAPRGSSQRNESLNNTVGSKAPKIRHYGGSASNDQRIACAVSQKNLGYTYLSPVMTKIGVSPGKYATMHADRMNQVSSQRKASHQVKEVSTSFSKVLETERQRSKRGTPVSFRHGSLK